MKYDYFYCKFSFTVPAIKSGLYILITQGSILGVGYFTSKWTDILHEFLFLL